MIKNEGVIIERCIDALNTICDAFCILDTGSTDDTIEKCTNILKRINKPFVINVDKFKNFGYTRSVSFKKVQEFCSEKNINKHTAYALCIDADMVLNAPDVLKLRNYIKSKMMDGYMIIQKQGEIKYFNNRFLRCDINWKCLGSTHEYWTHPRYSINKIDESLIFIEDKNDGGCKSDKFTRDLGLLIKELKEEPTNTRTHFYLAQTLKDLGRYNDSISFYKKRIDLGGWEEEVWYSYYQIGKCYDGLKDEENMERWMNKAYEIRKTRLEPLYFLVKYFRVNSKFKKAEKYLNEWKKNGLIQTSDILFVEYDLYNKSNLFDYEETILHYYLSPNKKEGLLKCIDYINKNDPSNYLVNNVWDNIDYYIEDISKQDKVVPLNCSVKINYNPTNPSCVRLSDGKLLVNIRLVNYKISERGNYIFEGSKVLTKNAFCIVDEISRTEFCGNSVLEMIDADPEIKTYDKDIEGIEDIRLFRNSDKIYFTASAKNFTPNDNIEMIFGEYDYKNKLLKDIEIIKSPTNSSCEKNWLFFSDKNEHTFIYSWFPYRILGVSGSIISYDVPNFFSRFRGSAPPLKIRNEYFTLTHFVKNTQSGRRYYHCIVVLDEKFKPVKYSTPFYFVNKGIEYCMSLLKDTDDEITFIFSQNDANPSYLKKKISDFEFIPI